MKTVYPIIATALSAVLLCGCLRYSPNLLSPTGTETDAKDYSVEHLPFVPAETTDETETAEDIWALTPRLEPKEPILTFQEQTADESTAASTYGTAGRIEIPSAGISVPLYFVRLEIDDVMRIVNAPDSAAFFRFKDRIPVIADQNDQGFANLKNIHKGDIAVAAFEDGHSGKYECNCVCYGTCTGSDILDNEGFSIAGTVTADLIMYTCVDGWQNVLLTYWKAVA